MARTWSSSGSVLASPPAPVSPACERIAATADRDLAAVPDGGGQGNTVSVAGVQRPAEIVNYRTTGAAPALLAVGARRGRGDRARA